MRSDVLPVITDFCIVQTAQWLPIYSKTNIISTPPTMLRSLLLLSLVYVLVAGFAYTQDCPTDYNNVPYGLTTNPTAPILKGNVAPGQIRRFGHHPNWFKWDVPQARINNIVSDSTYFHWGRNSEVRDMKAPWFDDNPDLNEIQRYKDYKNEDGWELLNQYFGVEYNDNGSVRHDNNVAFPRFVLYNKYRSLMRVFWYVESSYQYDSVIFNTTLIRDNFNPRSSKIPNLLMPNVGMTALDKLPFAYYSDTNHVLKYTPDYIVKTRHRKSWMYADYSIQYDPCVCLNTSSLYFELYTLRRDTIGSMILTDIDRYDVIGLFTPGSLNSSVQPSGSGVLRYLLPYYNNPLGVFNLLRTPKAVIEKKYRGKENCSKEFDWSGLMKTCNFRWDEVIQHRVKLVSPIDYVVNPATGLDVEDVKSELVVEYDSTIDAGEWSNAESRSSQNSNTVREGSATWKTTRMPIGCLPYSHVDAHAIRRGMHSVIQHNPWQSNPCNKYSCDDIPYYQHPTLKSISVRIFVTYKEKNAPYRTFVQSYLYPVEYTDATDREQFTTVDASCAIPNPPKDAVTVRAFCESNSDNGYKPAEREFIPNNVTIARTKDGKKILPSYPNTFTISNVYPNPFSTQTTFSYTVSVQGRVVVTVYDALGAKVSTLVDESNHGKGIFSQTFDASNIAPGTYYVVLQSGEVFESTPMMVIR